MKSEIRLKVEAEEWKQWNENGNTVRMSFPRAVKKIVQTFKSQNIVPVVRYEGEYAVIQAAA